MNKIIIYLRKLIIIIILLEINVERYFFDNYKVKIYSKSLELSNEFNQIYSNLYFLAREGRAKSPLYNNSIIKPNKLNIGLHIFINSY